MEVPEIFDGTVEVKSVSREAGDRSKIAVYASKENIDPIGACVGPKGNRVRNVVNELNGEMIDIIEWNENPAIFISHALSPSEVVCVDVNEKEHTALVIVPDNQLSLAIGKRGQNARLAVRLTGWKIDIKSVSEANEEGIVYGQDAEFEKQFEEEMIKDEVANNTEEFVDEFIEEGDISLEDETFDENEDEEVNEIETDIVEVEESIETNEILNIEEVDEVDESEDYVDDYDQYDDEDDYEYEEYDYDPKYDEDIDYDEYDKYYDEK